MKEKWGNVFDTRILYQSVKMVKWESHKFETSENTPARRFLKGGAGDTHWLMEGRTESVYKDPATVAWMSE